MSTEIYYFSGTGNSLFVAKELQKRIAGVKLIPMLSLLNRNVIKVKGETAGFVFPVYCHTVPNIVKEFIRKLDLESAYIFAAATTAGSQYSAYTGIDKMLKKKGKGLDSWFTIKMPTNMPFYIDYGEMTDKTKTAKMESGARARIESIAGIIAAKKKHRKKEPQFTRPIPSLILPFMPVLIPLTRLIVKKISVFYSDSKCTGCGICEKVCLSGKIKMIRKKPVWQKDIECYQCQACINYCPSQSIQQKSAWFMKSYSEKNGRRHHTEITANDIAGQK